MSPNSPLCSFGAPAAPVTRSPFRVIPQPHPGMRKTNIHVRTEGPLSLVLLKAGLGRLQHLPFDRVCRGSRHRCRRCPGDKRDLSTSLPEPKSHTISTCRASKSACNSVAAHQVFLEGEGGEAVAVGALAGRRARRQPPGDPGSAAREAPQGVSVVWLWTHRHLSLPGQFTRGYRRRAAPPRGIHTYKG